MSGERDQWSEAIAGAQAWWREAGVDLAFVDDPTDWLAGARAKAQAAADEPPRGRGPEDVRSERADARGRRLNGDAIPPPLVGGDSARWPKTLADFGPWWLTEPSLDPAPAARRVLPAGPAQAPLMVLVPMPEADDREALLSDRAGRLLDAILKAFGYTRAEVYLASALPCPQPAADWAAIAASGMREVVAHHIALAAPQRLIVFGRDVSPLLGHDPAQSSQSSRFFDHDGGSVPLMFAPELEALLKRPAGKRGVWARWLEWTGSG